MFENKRKKRYKIFWAIISLMVILSMVVWTIGLAFIK